MNFEDLRIANLARCEQVFHPLTDWSIVDWAVAVAGETGEMCNLVKKQRRGEQVTNADIAEEVADIIIYADLLCSRIGINLEYAVKDKFNKDSYKRRSTISIK